jgi:hypothetical protein
MGVMNIPEAAKVTTSRKAKLSAPTRLAVSTATGIMRTTPATGVRPS